MLLCTNVGGKLSEIITTSEEAVFIVEAILCQTEPSPYEVDYHEIIEAITNDDNGTFVTRDIRPMGVIMWGPAP